MRSRRLLVTALSMVLAFSANAVEYTMIKGDTLWSLAKLYLKDPYQWPRITHKDGSKIVDERRIPIGTVVLIPNSLANQKAKAELKPSTDEPDKLELLVTDTKTVTPIKNAKSVTVNEPILIDDELTDTTPPVITKALLIVDEADTDKEEEKSPIVNRPVITNASLEKMIRSQQSDRVMRLLDYNITKKEGNVRAYFGDQEVVIDVAILIEEMEKARGKQQ